MRKRARRLCTALIHLTIGAAPLAGVFAQDDPRTEEPRAAHSEISRDGWTFHGMNGADGVRFARGAWHGAASSAEIAPEQIRLAGPVRLAGPEAYIVTDRATIRGDFVETGAASLFWGTRRFEVQRVAISTEDSTVHFFGVDGRHLEHTRAAKP